MCNFSGMIKNVLPSLRQRAGPQRNYSRQKSIRSSTARDSFSQTPQMRGKSGDGVRKSLPGRITPAYAGKRAGSSGDYSTAGDHPRMCGEKCPQKAFRPHQPGSPPHVRGKAAGRWLLICCKRITPACAGKRNLSESQRYLRRDHPRMCGEKVLARLFGPFLGGITPACAGKRPDRAAALT